MLINFLQVRVEGTKSRFHFLSDLGDTKQSIENKRNIYIYIYIA